MVISLRLALIGILVGLLALSPSQLVLATAPNEGSVYAIHSNVDAWDFGNPNMPSTLHSSNIHAGEYLYFWLFLQAVTDTPTRDVVIVVKITSQGVEYAEVNQRETRQIVTIPALAAGTYESMTATVLSVTGGRGTLAVEITVKDDAGQQLFNQRYGLLIPYTVNLPLVAKGHN